MPPPPSKKKKRSRILSDFNGNKIFSKIYNLFFNVYRIFNVTMKLFFIEATLCQSVITCIAASISIQPDNMHVYQIISSAELPKDIKSTTKKKENALATPKTQEAGEAWLIKHCLQILSLASKGLS